MGELASPDRQEPPLKLPTELPLLTVRDVVVFPTMVMPLAVGREKSIRAVEEAMSGHHRIFITTQKKVQTEDPQESDLYTMGTVSEVLQMVKCPTVPKILVEASSVDSSAHCYYQTKNSLKRLSSWWILCWKTMLRRGAVSRPCRTIIYQTEPARACRGRVVSAYYG